LALNNKHTAKTGCIAIEVSDSGQSLHCWGRFQDAWRR